jgi:CBS domain containing-hemolysin-like protein
METTILIIIASLILSAFFSGMEIAYVSANRVHIEIEKKKGGFFGKILSKITEKPSRFIATMLVGNNIVVVVYGIFMGELLLNLLSGLLPTQNAFVEYLLTDLELLTHTAIATLVILITAEFFPKVFFQVYANSLLRFFALPAYIFYVVFAPVSAFVIWLSDLMLSKIFKTKGDEVQLAFTKSELGNYINEQMEEVEEDEEVDSEVRIFQNALEFSEVKSREVMIPRNEIVAVDISTPPKDLIKIFTETGLSKILVFRETNDDIAGYIHSFELFRKPQDLASILIPVVFVPETMLVKNVLNILIKKRKSIAVVIDEYGGTSGMMTVEDIVEELFGEIEDEHDPIALVEEKIDEETYRFSGRMEVDYINETYKIDLPESDNYETLGGMIVRHTEEIPERGGTVNIDGFKIKILEVSNTRIELVEVRVLEGE